MRVELRPSLMQFLDWFADIAYEDHWSKAYYHGGSAVRNAPVNVVNIEIK